ncbi:hypothetical protein KKG45_06615 [bacterium]|nr:hypothetical protein [bacterium]MBU1072900.1 hypothetical protein [bacterium]MBU1675947.1 hypothetical protein [bacterium]
MLRISKLVIGSGILSMLMIAAPAVMAQEGEYGHDHGDAFDTTTAPLTVPSAVDFAPVPGDGDDETGEDGEKDAAGAGISTYVDVTENMKAGVLTPFYRFSPMFAMKAHVPLIFDRTLNYFGYDASASGLGDITLDAEYTKPLAAPGTQLRFAASVKLPTGNEEKTVEDDTGFEYAVPLGTGTTDYILRGQYAKSTPKRGLLFGLMYRKNSPVESVFDYGTYTATTKTTNASQIVGSVFGRHRASRSWWLHMGATIVKLGDGKSETEFSDGSPTVDNGANMAGTLIDLFPGVSYALGKFNPFVGVRIPVATSYDNEFRDDKRDTSIIFQFSYRPESMAR